MNRWLAVVGTLLFAGLVVLGTMTVGNVPHDGSERDDALHVSLLTAPKARAADEPTLTVRLPTEPTERTSQGGLPITWRALDSGGHVLADAALSISLDGTDFVTLDSTHNSAGHRQAWAQLPPSSATVALTAPGHRTQEIPLGRIEHYEILALGDVELTRATPALGRVVDRRSRPVPEVIVTAVSTDVQGLNARHGERITRTSTTDADGTFRFEDLVAGSWNIDFEHRDFVFQSQRDLIEIPNAFVPGVTVDVEDIVLEQGWRCDGVVVDRHGVALPGVLVCAAAKPVFRWHSTWDDAVLAAASGEELLANGVFWTRSNARGGFSFTRLAEGTKQHIHAIAHGRPIAHVGTDASRASRGERLVVAFGDFVETNVRFVDADTGEPVSVTSVSTHMAQLPAEARPSSTHPLVMPGRSTSRDRSQWVVVHSREGPASVSVKAPKHRPYRAAITSVVALMPAGEVRVGVSDTEGAPLAGVEVMIRNPVSRAGRGELEKVLTNEDGVALFPNVAVGARELTTRGRRLVGSSASFDVKTGETTDVSVQVERRDHTLTITMRDADGALTPARVPRLQAATYMTPWIFAVDEVPNEWGGQTVAGGAWWVAPGTFVVEGLAPGEYRVWREPGGEAFIDFAGTHDQKLELQLGRWPLVRGLVTLDGMPLEGAWVSSRDADAPKDDICYAPHTPLIPEWTCSDANGRWQLPMFSGERVISVSAVGRNETHRLELVPGEVYDVAQAFDSNAMTGVVVDDRGEAVSGAIVWLQSGGRAVSDDRGHFKIPHAAPGATTLSVRHPDCLSPGAFPVNARHDHVRVVLSRVATAEVEVPDAK